MSTLTIIREKRYFLRRLLSRHLVEAGASVRRKTRHSGAPLHIAAEVGSEKIVAMLLDQGAEVNDTREDYGHTPLHFAARNGHENIVKLLLEGGADSTIKNGRKDTPLALAKINGFHSIVKRLQSKRKWIF